jgi:hypothetical protein
VAQDARSSRVQFTSILWFQQNQEAAHGAASSFLEMIRLNGYGKNGAGDRDRTGDIQLGKLAFYR